MRSSLYESCSNPSINKDLSFSWALIVDQKKSMSRVEFLYRSSFNKYCMLDLEISDVASEVSISLNISYNNNNYYYYVHDKQEDNTLREK